MQEIADAITDVIRRYEPVKTRLIGITRNFSSKRFAFVDGGNSPLLQSPSFTAGIIRTAVITMRYEKTISTDINTFAAFAYKKKDNNAALKTFSLPTTGHLPETIAENIGKSRLDMETSELLSLMRRMSEIETCIDLAKSLDEGDIIVLDGALDCMHKPEKEMMQELIKTCVDNNILIIAVAKTTTIVKKGDTITARLSYIKEDSGPWYTIIDGRFYAKLHKRSGHIFRIGFAEEQIEDIDLAKVMGMLYFYSRDIAFPGYPYGLLKADRFARVSDEESEMLRTKLLMAGLEKEISPYIRSVDAHNILDNM